MYPIIKTFLLYLFLFYIFSALLTVSLTNYIQPITKNNAYRFFGIIPLREVIGIPPISFLVWFYISKKITYRKLNMQNLLFESIIAMFITGLIIHKIFGINSKLGQIFKITNKPDGRGLAPYSNY